MFKENYRDLCNQIQPDEKLIDKTIRRVHNKAGGRRGGTLRKPILALAVLCFCIFAALPVLAATVEPVYRLMYLVSPSAAQFFMPVQKSDEENGIKMEVVSAYIHGNTAQIYITLQDRIGERIDGTVDLYDSYSINRSFDSAAHCELVGYEEDSKKATFLITIWEWGNKNISGDKITFSVREFLSHKNIYEDILIPIELSSVSNADQIQTVSSTGGGGNYESRTGEDSLAALTASSPMQEFPVDGIEMTGIGFIDGKLHVQTAVKERLENDNHGFFYLKAPDGKRIDCSYNFYFIKQDDSQGRIDYCEYVFDVPQDELENYSLYGDFVTCGMKTEGNWRVTFPLKEKE